MHISSHSATSAAFHKSGNFVRQHNFQIENVHFQSYISLQQTVYNSAYLLSTVIYCLFYFFVMSMELPEGQILGLIGKNGAGKSTAIKLILGLCRADEGSIRVFGHESKELPETLRQEIGVSLAESGFSGELTVNDVKHILKKMYHSFDENYFIKQSENLKLPMNKKIKEFSTGMKAKLRVLTAMTHHAKLLIMDEPTAGLDVEARNEILDMLRAYIAEDESRSILITSHISTDLESLCDELYLIHDGKLILHEATDAILEQYGILKVSEEQYRTLDQSSILKVQKENYGYACFTNDKKFYQENYPQIAVENGGIDELILMMTGGGICVFEIGRATIISSQNKRITRIILAFLASLLTISINPIGMILWDFINWRHINSFAHYFTKAYWIIILIHMLLFWLGEEIGYQNSKENN
jgi:ABC-2 type transport system ATP-binding protein